MESAFNAGLSSVGLLNCFKRLGTKPFLLIVSLTLFLTSIPSIAQSTAAKEPLAQTEERFNCKTNDEWSQGAASGNGAREHGITKCGQDWALRNANELVTIRAVQLREMRDELERAKQGSAASQDSYQSKLANDHFCKQPGEESFNECYDRMKRHVLSQGVQLRESTIQNNTSRYVLGDTEEAKVSAATESSNSKQPGIAKSGLQVIQEYRQQKSPPGQQRRNPCAENPFVPCVVTFGKGASDNSLQTPDDASAKMIQGTSVSAVLSKQLEGVGNQGKEAEVQAGIDQALNKQIEMNLQNRQSTFSKAAFGRDIEHAKAIQNELNERDRKGGKGFSDPNSGSSASWSAFQKTMAIIEDQEKTQQKTRDPNESHTYTLQIQRTLNQNANGRGRTPGAATSAPENTGDGIVQDTLGMAPPSPSASP